MAAYGALINPYQGCTFGCSYCYAAGTTFTRNPARSADWGNWVDVKQNGQEVGAATRIQALESPVSSTSCRRTPPSARRPTPTAAPTSTACGASNPSWRKWAPLSAPTARASSPRSSPASPPLQPQIPEKTPMPRFPPGRRGHGLGAPPLTRQETPPHFTYPNVSTAVLQHELPDSENPNHTSRIPARAPHSGPRQPSPQQPLHSATHPTRNTTVPPYTFLIICLYSYTNISLCLHTSSPDLSQYRHFTSSLSTHTDTHVQGNTDPEPLAASDTPLPALKNKAKKRAHALRPQIPERAARSSKRTHAPYPKSTEKEQMP